MPLNRAARRQTAKVFRSATFQSQVRASVRRDERERAKAAEFSAAAVTAVTNDDAFQKLIDDAFEGAYEVTDTDD